MIEQVAHARRNLLLDTFQDGRHLPAQVCLPLRENNATLQRL
ncbi:MAG TPA: hypothetical protein VFL42_00325 [Terriglobales bacterium]|nr:hypothetical protein [Terriglobales bacterium]